MASKLYELFLQHPTITTDSRHCPDDSVFFALKGDTFDGNLYAAQALRQGCAYAVVDNPSVIPEGDSRYVLVDDVLKALQQLAHEHRTFFRFPVIEVTGTNGKTTTKELLFAVLSQKFYVLATEGNFNNHIGVPKTLLRLNKEHTMAVIETGANHPGEIKTLAELVDPDYGIITNVGRAHLEGFGSFEGVIRTKGELYDYLRGKSGTAIFRDGDNPYLRKISQGIHSICYGVPGENNYRIQGEVVDCSPYLQLRWRRQGGDWQCVKTNLVGAYNLQNALAAICVGDYFDVPAHDINQALENYHPTNDRSELRVTAHNRLIVDTYNANPTSMRAALENFVQMKGDHKMVILGEMRELGSASVEEHQRIVDFVREAGFEEVWLVGENFGKTDTSFRLFENVDAVKAELKKHTVENRLILIKGSNGTKLFQLPELL